MKQLISHHAQGAMLMKEKHLLTVKIILIIVFLWLSSGTKVSKKPDKHDDVSVIKFWLYNYEKNTIKHPESYI